MITKPYHKKCNTCHTVNTKPYHAPPPPPLLQPASISGAAPRRLLPLLPPPHVGSPNQQLHRSPPPPPALGSRPLFSRRLLGLGPGGRARSAPLLPAAAVPRPDSGVCGKASSLLCVAPISQNTTILSLRCPVALREPLTLHSCPWLPSLRTSATQQGLARPVGTMPGKGGFPFSL